MIYIYVHINMLVARKTLFAVSRNPMFHLTYKANNMAISASIGLRRFYSKISSKLHMNSAARRAVL